MNQSENFRDKWFVNSRKLNHREIYPVYSTLLVDMQKSICNFLLHCDFVFLRLFELSESHSNQVQDPKAESTTSTIQLTWVKPEGGVTGYRVVLTPKGGQRSEVKVEDGEATRPRSWRGWSPVESTR